MREASHPLLAIDVLARRELVGDGAPLAPLADSLARDLERVLSDWPGLPARKARLTRIGGRCPIHGVLLEFDPWQPHDHRCSRCDVVYRAREHDDWWMMGAHLWTIERAVHAAALFLLRGDERHAIFAGEVLRQNAANYQQYDNRDNVLGPSRLFFSTYLESIWLLNACHAVALLELASRTAQRIVRNGDVSIAPYWSTADAQRFRERVIAPASYLIDGYHEGRSNRQIWNEVAICSAWRLIGDDQRVRDRLADERGISGLIAHGLDTDGFWYEGENYHLFAHRGMWYGVELMRAMEQPLSATCDAQYRAGFVAPLLGVLPDETFPSRRDSQYASSIRQWRTAEWCELGWAHSADARLAGILQTLYEPGHPRRDTGRACSTADSERNMPATSLTRADLSWRALLMAAAEVPSAASKPLGTVCLPSQGLAILRRERGHTYVALDGGETGGGHGHPDQLALTLQTGDDRWLEDPGTGSYVEPRLFWYRSTLAHAAPFVDGVSQHPAAATLEAFDDAAAFGWVVKRVAGVANGVTLERTIVVGESYLVDLLTWTSSESHEITLPIAGVAERRMEVSEQDEHLQWLRAAEALSHSSAPTSPLSADDPFVFVMDRESLTLAGPVALRTRPSHAQSMSANDSAVGAPHAHVWYSSSAPAVLHRAVVPATPGQGETQRHWLSTRAAQGSIVGVWNWPTLSGDHLTIRDVQLTPEAATVALVVFHDGGEDRHEASERGWRVDRVRENAPSTVQLSRLSRNEPRALHDALSQPTGNASMSAATPATTLRVPRVASDVLQDNAGSNIASALRLVLGESHYVRTEQPWADADAPTAVMQLAASDTHFVVDVHARTGPIVVNASPDNPLDNEPGDVNADGVQWYFRSLESAKDAGDRPREVESPTEPRWQLAGLVVPHEPSGRHTALASEAVVPDTAWRETPDGWSIRLSWALELLPINPHGEVAFELVVNERPATRERRRGQLVVSGGGGFGYLAGARRPAGQFVRLIIPAPAPKRRSDDGSGLS